MSDPAEAPSAVVLVCASPRTGSGLLCSALWETGVCGRPDEYLGPETRQAYRARWGVHAEREYVERVLAHGTTPNGVFSMKVHGDHLPGDPRDPGWFEPIARFVPPRTRLHVYWLTRRDRVRQAASLYLALHTRRFRRLADESAEADGAVAFDPRIARRLIHRLARSEMAWADRFAVRRLEPTRIVYEDDLESDYQGTVMRILGDVGVELPAGVEIRSPYRKQADPATERLVEQYRDAVWLGGGLL